MHKDMEDTWDTIADSFDKTRRNPWNQCLEYISGLDPSFMVADLGCGNGRHTIPCLKQCKQVIGIDISKNLLSIVKEKTNSVGNNIHFIHANLIDIPLQDEIIDAALYIAALHNIPKKEQRLQSLKELFRILKQGSTALITVWSRWQDKFQQGLETNKNSMKYYFENGDIEIYWRQDKLNIPRYYHLYDKDEFQNELENSGFLIKKITEEYISFKEKSDNYFAYVQKI